MTNNSKSEIIQLGKINEWVINLVFEIAEVTQIWSSILKIIK
jgi:hypothetical protein